MELLTRVFEQLLSMALTALPVMAVVLLVRLALKRAPKKYSYALWLVVAFRLVCPVAVSTAVSIVPGAFSSGAAVTEWAGTYTEDTWVIPEDSVYYDAAVTAGRQPVTDENGQSYVVAVEDQLGEPKTVKDTWLPALSVLWLAGAAAMLGWMLAGRLRLRRLVAAAVRREGNVWECGSIPTPFVLGLFRPRVYIPFRLSEEERACVLAHERYHLRRLDHWTKALGLGILTVYWWNPAVWLCWTLFCRDMEMSCDEAVLARLGGDVKRGYSLSLVSFALDRRFPVALAFGEHDAKRRVKNVLRWKRAKPAALALGAAAVLAVAVVCGTNADTRSHVTTEHVGNGVRITARLKEPVRSWAVYEDIYENGMLVSSKPRVMDGFQEDGTGVSPRRLAVTLRAEPVNAPGGGLESELNCSFGENGATAQWTLALPEHSYTGMAATLGNGDLNRSAARRRDAVETGGEVLLYSVLLSTDPEGETCVYARDRSLSKVNDVAVQYRLVTSAGTAEAFREAPLDLAQTLFDLRVETLKDPEDPGGLKALRTLLDALGVGDLGTYELLLYDTSGDPPFLTAKLSGRLWDGTGIYDGEDGLLIRFLEPGAKEKPLLPPILPVALPIRLLEPGVREKPGEEWEEGVSFLLQALAPDLRDACYSWPQQAGGTYSRSLFMEDGDWIAEELGYGSLAELGRSAQGIRTLLAYLNWLTDPEVCFADLFLPAETAGGLLDGYTPSDLYRLDETAEQDIPCYVYYRLTRAQYQQLLDRLGGYEAKYLSLYNTPGDADEIACVTVSKRLSAAEVEALERVLQKAPGAGKTPTGPE